MSEIKDPAIKLFGKTIPLWPTDKLYTPMLPNQQHPPPDPNISLILDPSSSLSDKPCTSEEDEDEEEEEQEQEEEEEDPDGKKPTEDESTTSSDQEPATKPSETSSRYDDPKTPSLEKEPISPKVSNKDQSDTQDTTLTKPDKILPCPRCNSMDTKFCYFNNYNVNQPRHFCKNCQRYWTAGGTMRNVPVGSGRRKNKSSPSSSSSSSSSTHYRHALAMEALQAAGGTHYPVLRPNVITFGSDAPLCESMNSTLNLGEKSVNHVGDDIQQEAVVKNFPTLPIPYYAGPAWPMPWRAPAATFAPPGFPTLIYPAPPPPFWGCVPIIPTNTMPTEAAISYGPSSPLGKHSREGNIFGSKEVGGGDVGGRGVLVHPKTLRIDDPNEAAKSSIWSTLGIKNENLDSVIGRGLFKPLNSKSEVEHRTSLAMQANPVALSRSQNFRENAP